MTLMKQNQAPAAQAAALLAVLDGLPSADLAARAALARQLRGLDPDWKLGPAPRQALYGAAALGHALSASAAAAMDAAEAALSDRTIAAARRDWARLPRSQRVFALSRLDGALARALCLDDTAMTDTRLTVLASERRFADAVELMGEMRRQDQQAMLLRALDGAGLPPDHPAQGLARLLAEYRLDRPRILRAGLDEDTLLPGRDAQDFGYALKVAAGGGSWRERVGRELRGLFNRAAGRITRACQPSKDRGLTPN